VAPTKSPRKAESILEVFKGLLEIPLGIQEWLGAHGGFSKRSDDIHV
jgi:hypothetical protein